MKKHIVISAFSARRGGGRTYLYNILNYLPINQNLNVTILVSKKYEIETIPDAVFIEIVNFPVDNPFFRVLWELFILPIYLRKTHTDVFFCPGGTIPRFGFGAWKTVTMFRNMIPFDLEQRKKWPLGYMRMRNWILKRIMIKSMERADMVIFIAEHAKNLIQNISYKSVNNCVVIPHGVGDEFDSQNTSISIESIVPSEKSYILYPSIIDVYKSQIEVVTAYAEVVKSVQSAPILLFVGEVYGQYGSDVIKLIKQLKMQNHIQIIGAIDYNKMPSLYRNAELIIFASQSENCPNILLEAMKSSSAIVCSNVMPMPEFAGNSVEYINPTCPDDIAEKIIELLLNPKKIEQLKKMSSEASKEYRWDVSSEKTWKALTNV